MQTTKAKAPDFDADAMKRNKGYGAKSSVRWNLTQHPQHSFPLCLKDAGDGAPQGLPGELKTLMTKKGGNMFTGYIQKIRESAIASVPDKDKASLQYPMGVKSIDLSKLPKAKGPGLPGGRVRPKMFQPLSGRS